MGSESEAVGRWVGSFYLEDDPDHPIPTFFNADHCKRLSTG